MIKEEKISPHRTKLEEKFLSPENHTDRIVDLYDHCDILDLALGKTEQRIYKLEVKLFWLTVYSIVITLLFLLF